MRNHALLFIFIFFFPGDSNNSLLRSGGSLHEDEEDDEDEGEEEEDYDWLDNKPNPTFHTNSVLPAYDKKKRKMDQVINEDNQKAILWNKSCPKK